MYKVVGVSAVLSVGKIFSQMLFIMISARLLGPEDFGSAAILIIILSVVPEIVSGSYYCLQVRENSIFPVRVGIVVLLLIPSFYFLLLYCGGYPVLGLFGLQDLTPVVELAAIVVFFPFLYVNSKSRLALQEKYTQLSVVDAVSFCSGYSVFGLLLIYTIGGVESLILTYVVNQIILCLSFLLLDKFYGKNGSWFSKKMDVSSFFYVILSRGLNYISSRIDNLIIGAGMGSVTLGHYSKAYQMGGVFSQIFQPLFDFVIFPAFARSAKYEKVGLKKISMVFLPLVVFLLPVSVVLSFSSSIITMVLLGPGWGVAATCFEVLAFAAFIRPSAKVFDSFILAKGSLKRRFFLKSFYAGLVVFSAIVGVKFGDIYIVSVLIVSSMLMNLFASIVLALWRLEFDWEFFVKNDLRVVAVSLLFSTLLYSTLMQAKRLVSDSLVLFFTNISLGVICICLSILFMKGTTLYGEAMRVCKKVRYKEINKC